MIKTLTPSTLRLIAAGAIDADQASMFERITFETDTALRQRIHGVKRRVVSARRAAKLRKRGVGSWFAATTVNGKTRYFWERVA